MVTGVRSGTIPPEWGVGRGVPEQGCRSGSVCSLDHTVGTAEGEYFLSPSCTDREAVCSMRTHGHLVVGFCGSHIWLTLLSDVCIWWGQLASL